MTPVNQKAVLYVDLLGFSALTENVPVEMSDFVVVDIKHQTRGEFLRAFESLGSNRLIDRYAKFNMALDDTVHGHLLGENELTVISFSDAAFIAVDSVWTAISMGRDILTLLLCARIPVRCAVAFGSFIVVRFRSDLSERARTHAAQFVGTGVVWSHAATELAGIKGMRILLHSSAVAVLDEPEHAAPAPALTHQILDLPLEERQNPAGVTLEAGYLNTLMLAVGATRDNPKLHDLDGELWDAVKAMQADAPPTAQTHYAATRAAINRMRRALGRDAFYN